MKEHKLVELQQIFREAQVDLPPGLKARLLAIPTLEQRPAFGILRSLSPVLALIPGFLWVVIRYRADLFGYITNLTRGLGLPELPRLTVPWDFTLPTLFRIPVLSELSLPTLPEITPSMALLFAATAAMVVVFTAGFYLWRESQMDVQYMQLLNRSR